MNQLMLIGNIVDIVKLKEDNNVIKLVIGVKNIIKDNEFELRYFSCIIRNSMSDNILKYCRKNDVIGIRGRLNSKIYDGVDEKIDYLIGIDVDSISFLSSGKNSDKI